ncbi:MAG: preprotein translocase subunit SecG [Bdellovibrionaceae bacterium]|nr:preprotein translocase subunit SecG [Pseudobdellovibrionaceae bacterium]
MLTALTILHLFIAVLLILFVLLQDSKGDASGIIGGGGNQSVFGSTGASNFLVKATRTIAFFFAVSSIALVYVTTSKSGKSVIDSIPATSLQQEAPAVPGEAGVPAEETTASPALPENTN